MDLSTAYYSIIGFGNMALTKGVFPCNLVEGLVSIYKEQQCNSTVQAVLKNFNLTLETNPTTYVANLHGYGLLTDSERNVLFCAGDHINVCSVSVIIGISCQFGR